LLANTFPAISDDSYVFAYQGDVAIVIRNGKDGIIDIYGNSLSDCKYDRIYPFVNGFAKTKIDDMYGIIDNCGNVILKNEWRYIYNTGYSYITTDLDGTCTLLDIKGDYIDSKMYEYMSCNAGYINAYTGNFCTIYSIQGDPVVQNVEARYIVGPIGGVIIICAIDGIYTIADLNGN